MQEPKWFVRSKTLIGLLLTMLPVLLPMIGISFDAADQALVGDFADKVIQLTGAALIVYARFKDGSQLTVTPPG